MRFMTFGAALAAAALPPSLSAAGTWTYPPAPRDATVDRYAGATVPDPYRPLENLDAPATQRWVEAENRLTFGFLHSLPQRAWFEAELKRLLNYPRYSAPAKRAGRCFYTKNDGLQNQPVLYVEGPGDAPARVLLDLNTRASDGTIALSSWAVSNDGRWMAYATAAAGSDWNVIRVRDVATARDAADEVRWVKFSDLSWTKDGKGFFYSRFPAPAVAGAGQTFGELENHRLYYHRLGTPQSDDHVVFSIPDHPKWLLAGDVTDDGRYLVVSVARGDSNNILSNVADMGDPLNPRIDAPAIPLVKEWTSETGVIGNRGSTLFLQTNLDAPRRRIVAVDFGPRGPGPWREVLPQGGDTIESSLLAGGKLVVLRLRDASSRLDRYTLDGAHEAQIALPGLGDVPNVNGRMDDTEIFYGFTSFTQPLATYRYDLATGRGAVYRRPEVAFDPDGFETKQVFYRSKDGTRIPMFITARKGLKIDRHTPSLLYAYGGFDINLTPSFSTTNLVWLETGGIYAQPNLRGGGEYGRAWHEAGTKERKQNVFDDYIAAAEWLFANGYTSPERLVISGGSNGGLLVGATLNQRPDLCRVAWPAVGVMDMLRFHKFTIGWAWEADYGSSDTADGFRYLRAYSPLHNVIPGAHYPAVLVTTADHDDRVYPAHSFKYTATMQERAYNGPGALPVMVRIETRAGHGAGKPIGKIIDETADKLAFAAHFLDIETPPLRLPAAQGR